MVKNHIKRLAAPKTWPINRKKHIWVTRQSSGTHRIDQSLPMSLVLKEFLSYAKTTKETKQILSSGKIMVDGVVRKEHKFPVGLLDVLNVDGESYRVIMNTKGKLVLHPVKGEEANLKLRKIVRKQKVKKGKTQITCFDGYNKIIGKEKYGVSDTVVFDTKKNEVKEHLKFEKGAMVYITSGKQVGVMGTVEEVKPGEGFNPSKIMFKVGKETFETLKDYAFVVGKGKALISLPKDE